MTRKILVVDDEEDIEPLFRLRFRKDVKEGLLAFEFARSGEAALSLLASGAPDYVMILSDISMPGMNGIELLERIRAQYPLLPVVMVSAYGDDDTQSHVRSVGATGFVSKPIDFAHLRQQLLNGSP